jgi:NTE family protein
MGARLVIAVNLNADMLGRRPPTSGREHRNGAGLLDHLLGREGEGEPPGLIHVMATSLNILQDRLGRSRLAGDPPDVMIAPRVGHIGLMEFDRAAELIDEGRLAVERSRHLLEDALAVLAD